MAIRKINSRSIEDGAVSSADFSGTVSSLSSSGNLTFNTTSQRINGEFSNATVNSRTIFNTTTTNGTTGIYAIPNGTATAASWQATNNSDATNASKILIATNGSTDVQLVSGRNGTGTYLPLTFYTNGAEQVRLTTSGLFGIGVTNPGARLQVGDATSSTSNGIIFGKYAASTETNLPAIRQGSGDGAANDLVLGASSTSGNIRLFTGAANSSLDFGTSSNAERMRIAPTGYVGIAGAPTGLAMLDIRSNDTTIPQLFLEQDNTSHGWIFYADRSDGALKFYRRDNSGSTERMRILTSGQVGINATPATGNTLRVINIGTDNACQFGNASSGVYLPYASPTSWSAYSDSRLKDVIGNYENALDHILQLNPVKYTWKSDTNKKVNIGLLAQNVLEVVPEIVDENTLPDDDQDKTKYLSLRYTDLIPVLIGSIKELKAENDALKARLDAAGL